MLTIAAPATCFTRLTVIKNTACTEVDLSGPKSSCKVAADFFEAPSLQLKDRRGRRQRAVGELVDPTPPMRSRDSIQIVLLAMLE